MKQYVIIFWALTMILGVSCHDGRHRPIDWRLVQSECESNGWVFEEILGDYSGTVLAYSYTSSSTKGSILRAVWHDDKGHRHEKKFFQDEVQYMMLSFAMKKDEGSFVVVLSKPLNITTGEIKSD